MAITSSVMFFAGSNSSLKTGALLERRCGVRAGMDDNMMERLHFDSAESKSFMKII